MNYTYWVKPIADRPNVCSGYAKINPFGAYAILAENRYPALGYIELTEEQARSWHYDAGGELRSLVEN
jgi:hypothetical protein